MKRHSSWRGVAPHLLLAGGICCWIAGARAATAPPPAAAARVMQEQELDEILVNGKRLTQAIADAEDDFYQLYNKLNKDDRYDTRCVYLNADPDNPGSQIRTRMCIPGFVADAMVDWNQWKIRCQPPLQGYDEFSCLDRNHDNRISWQEATARPELESEFQSLDADHDGVLSRQEFAQHSFASAPVYQPPPPDLVLTAHSKDWYRHMMEVINSDPRLQQQAGHLDDLYRELAATQQRYDTVKASMPVKAVKPNTGPRVH